MITGGFRTVDAMEEAVESGDTDIVGMAGPFCVDTDFCRGLLDGILSEVAMVEERLLLDRARHGEGLDDRAFNLLESDHQLAWMYVQLVRLGDGLDAVWSMTPDQGLERFEVSEQSRERARRAALGEAAVDA